MPKTQQIAALPWRQGANGVEILLVTTRTTKRWVIPKGWTMDGKADHEAAAIEAFEEAGVRGVAEVRPMGRYGYDKIMANGKPRLLTVQVFAVEVQEVLDDWPEKSERERQWVTPKQALALVGEVELLSVITDFAKRHGDVLMPSNAGGGLVALFKRWWRQFF